MRFASSLSGRDRRLQAGSVFAVFIDQRRSQGGGDQLRQMADPGTELVVFVSVHAGYAGAELFYPLQEFTGHAFVNVLAGRWREKPSCSLEKVWVGKFDAGVFFSSHGVSGKKLQANILAEHFGGVGENLSLSASYIGEQGVCGKGRRQAINQIKDGADWRGQNYDIAAVRRLTNMGSGFIDSSRL